MVHDNEANASASIDGGGVVLLGATRAGMGNGGMLMLGIGKRGGFVDAAGTDGRVNIAIDEHGGKVAVFGAGQDAGLAVMAVKEYGGRVAVLGNGSSKGQAEMGVNQYGNGAVSTWDKNGYRQ